MSKRNPAELHLDQPAGSIPLVATGKEGSAYRVRANGKYLVLRSTAVQVKRSAKDALKGVETVASRWMWTDSLVGARRLVKGIALVVKCRFCVKCKQKPVLKKATIRKRK